MYRIFGWINVGLAVVMISPFVILAAAKLFHKEKNPGLKKLVRFLRRLHRPLGAVLVASALTHAILALGAFRLHTGTIVGFMIVLITLLGLLFYAVKKKWVVSVHRAAAYVMILLVLVHLIVPSAVYLLFGA